jgi:hypothetical protein
VTDQYQQLLLINDLKELLPIVAPILIIQLLLTVAAVVHILRHKQYRIGNRVIWLLVAILLHTIGPILYFVMGRERD